MMASIRLLCCLEVLVWEAEFPTKIEQKAKNSKSLFGHFFPDCKRSEKRVISQGYKPQIKIQRSILASQAKNNRRQGCLLQEPHEQISSHLLPYYSTLSSHTSSVAFYLFYMPTKLQKSLSLQFYQQEEMIETLPDYNHNTDQHYLVKLNKDIKCVCQLCDCGRHKCPKQQVKGQFDTSYGNHFKNFTIVPQAYKPRYQYQERHYNPEALKSNYQETFLEKDIAPTLSASRLENIGKILKSGPFVGNTSYNDEYKPFKIEPEIQEPFYSPSMSKSGDSKTKEVKFQGESMYKSAHHSLPMPKLEGYKHPEYKNTVPFTGVSSYKNEFQGFKIEPSQQPMPAMINNNRQVRFQGSSTYNSHFKPFQIKHQQKAQAHCTIDTFKLPQNNYKTNNQSPVYSQKPYQYQ